MTIAPGPLADAWHELTLDTVQLINHCGVNAALSSEREPVVAALQSIPTDAQPIKALRLIRAVINNSRQMEDFSPAQAQRIVREIQRWVTPRILATLPWDFVVVLCHKVVYALLVYDSERTDADWELAERCARFALSLMEHHAPDDIHLPDAIDMLGTVLLNRRNTNRVPRLQEAESLFKRNLAVAPRHNNFHEQKRALLNLGILNHELARQEPSRIFHAVDFYKDLEAVNRQHEPEDYMLGLVLTNRAWALIELPQEHQPSGYRRAIEDCTKAVALYRNDYPRKENLALALMYLGLAQSQLDKYEHAQHEEALRSFSEAQELFGQLRIADGYSRVVHNLGLHWMNVGEPRKALRYYLEALRFRAGQVIEEWETLGNIVDVRIQPEMSAFGTEDGDEFLLSRLESLSQQLTAHGDSERALRAHYYGLQLLGHAPSDEKNEIIFRWTERAISLAESVWTATDSQPLVRYHLGRWLGTFYAARMLIGIRRRESIDVLLRFAQKGKARTLIQERQGDSSASAGMVDSAALLKRLQMTPGTAFIEIGVSSLGTAVLVASLNSAGALDVQITVVDLHEEELVGLLSKPGMGWQWRIEALRSADGATQLEKLESCAAGMERILGILHERLLGPVTAVLRSRGVRDLVFAVHGPLAAFPLAAAWRTVDGEPRYLIEEFRSVSLSPSIMSFVYSEEPRRLSTCQYVVGNEHDLPREALSDRHILESVWRQASAVVPFLKNPSPEELLHSLEQVDLVHAVCHGDFEAWQLDKSGIRVGGGAILSCSRLLSDTSPKRISMVVVCACRSGRSRTEDFGAEWLGLSGILLRSGAQFVFAALWDVDYGATAHWSRGFYRYLFVDGQPAAIAASMAMRTLLEEGRRARQAKGPHWLLAGQSPQAIPRLYRLLDTPWLWAGMQFISTTRVT